MKKLYARTAMSDETEKKGKDEGGFTLVELILVIAIGAMIIAGAVVLYGKARDSAVQDTFVNGLQAVTAGITEYRTYKGGIPAGTSWSAITPAGALDTYVSADLQAKWGYSCAGGVLTITTPACDTTDQAKNILQHLADQGTCAPVGTSAIDANPLMIDCVVPAYNGSAGC